MFDSHYFKINQIKLTHDIGVVSIIVRNADCLKSIGGHIILVIEYVNNNEVMMESFDFGMSDKWLYYKNELIPNGGDRFVNYALANIGFYSKAYYGTYGVIRSLKENPKLSGDSLRMFPQECELVNRDYLKSWPIEKSKLLDQIARIQTEQLNPPEYRVFFRRAQQHQCASWVLQKLKELTCENISTDLSVFENDFVSPITIALLLKATEIGIDDNFSARVSRNLASLNPQCVLF